MNKLRPNEQILTGRWLVEDGRARADTTCERIEWLIAHHLKKIADNPQSGAWETLYRDPDDGRYWERTYPHGEMHGGGPPQLRCVTAEEARNKYQLRRPYQPEHAEGSRVRIASRPVLEQFLRDWKYHNKLQPEQLNYADHFAEIDAVGFYHGGDELYKLKGIPGVWHRECLLPANG